MYPNIPNPIQGPKVIKRYSPAVLAISFLGLAVIVGLLLYCFFPVLTLTYTESGITKTVNVNAFSFMQAFFERINSGAHTELGDSFLTFLRDQRGTSLNSVQGFLINGCAGRMEQVTMVTFVGLILLICCFAIPLAIVSLCGLIFGRLHFPSVISSLTFFTYFTLFVLVSLVFAFKWLYGDIITAIVNNTENAVTEGSIAPMYLPIIFLVAIVILHIVITILYRQGIKGRVYVKS